MIVNSYYNEVITMNIRSLILSFFTLILGSAALASAPHARNVIMLLDASEESIYKETSGFNRIVFNAALAYGKCPIIVSAPIVHAWLTCMERFQSHKDAPRIQRLTHQYGDLQAMRNKILSEQIKMNDQRIDLLQQRVAVDQKRLDDQLALMRQGIDMADERYARIKVQAEDAKNKLTLQKESLDKEFSAHSAILEEINTVFFNNNAGHYYCFAQKDALQNFNIYKC